MGSAYRKMLDAQTLRAGEVAQAQAMTLGEQSSSRRNVFAGAARILAGVGPYHG